MSSYTEKLKKLHDAADEILPFAKSFGRNFCNLDSSTAEQLMNDAVDKVIDSRGDSLSEISNLKAYLYTTFKRHLLAWYKNQQIREIALESVEQQDYTNSFEEIEKKILLKEIVKNMNEEERFIYSKLILGYFYEEMIQEFEQKFGKKIQANALRSKYSKAIKRISKQVVGS